MCNRCAVPNVTVAILTLVIPVLWQHAQQGMQLCRVCKPNDKVHVVWVTTEGGDYDNTVLKPYEEALHEAKVKAPSSFDVL